MAPGQPSVARRHRPGTVLPPDTSTFVDNRPARQLWLTLMSDSIRTAIAAAAGGDPLPELRRLRELAAELARAEAEQVRRARSQGYSWVAIADALQVSRQAVHKKYGRR